MDGSNTQDSVPKCSSDEVLIQVNTDKSDTEVETGNEKTISGIRVISKAKRMVKQISNTLNTQVLHKQHSGTNLGFELSNYYLNEEILDTCCSTLRNERCNFSQVQKRCKM